MQPPANISDLLAVAIPDRLSRRPRDSRGFPQPFVVSDFRTTDGERWGYAVTQRRCGLCGEPLGSNIAFIGGPLSHESRLFTDVGMHRDCAEYALRVCPYLAIRPVKHLETIKQVPDELRLAAPEVSTDKPERFALGITGGFKVIRLPSGPPALLANPWKSVSWWVAGMEIDP